jgi:aspartate beta-hydroxylase
MTTTKRCVQEYQQKVLSEILSFSALMGRLDADAGLFMNCDEEGLIPRYQEDQHGDFYWEMLQILQDAPSCDQEALDVFDRRRNEMRMNESEAVDLYRKALLLHPNSTYIISQFGLTLRKFGYNHLTEMLWENTVQRGLWPSTMQRPELYYIPVENSKPWQNTDDFPFVAKLEAAHRTIRHELLSNLARQRQLVSEDVINRAAVSDNQWKVIHLKLPGASNYSDTAYEFFPETMNILKECGTDFILAKFSAIVPGTHIKAHTGPSNSQLRSHLGLVHTGGARIRVGEEWRTWTEGKVMIFDSSWEHEVHHDGPDLRIVLILDVWNPYISSEMYV